MAKRPVQQGETLPQIAAKEGFERWETIWDDSGNAELKKLRDPCILAPGDELTIPEHEPPTFTLPTGKRHRLVVERPKLSLIVAVQKYSGAPLTTAPGTLTADGKSFPVTPDGSGRIEQKIPTNTDFAELVFPDPDGGDQDTKIGMLVGHLDPIDEISGWRARLANLGYPVDVTSETEPEADDSLRLAVEEFQCDNGLPVTGERDDATKAKLVEVHGS